MLTHSPCSLISSCHYEAKLAIINPLIIGGLLVWVKELQSAINPEKKEYNYNRFYSQSIMFVSIEVDKIEFHNMMILFPLENF